MLAFDTGGEGGRPLARHPGGFARMQQADLRNTLYRGRTGRQPGRIWKIRDRGLARPVPALGQSLRSVCVENNSIFARQLLRFCAGGIGAGYTGFIAKRVTEATPVDTVMPPEDDIRYAYWVFLSTSMPVSVSTTS